LVGWGGQQGWLLGVGNIQGRTNCSKEVLQKTKA
jgi:hypothetical protein